VTEPPAELLEPRFYVATKVAGGKVGGLLVGPCDTEEQATAYLDQARDLALTLVPAVKAHADVTFWVMSCQSANGAWSEGKLNSRLGFVPRAAVTE
jgi:hypothetical protein